MYVLFHLHYQIFLIKQGLGILENSNTLFLNGS